MKRQGENDSLRSRFELKWSLGCKPKCLEVRILPGKPIPLFFTWLRATRSRHPSKCHNPLRFFQGEERPALCEIPMFPREK